MSQLKNNMLLRKNDFEIIQSYLRSGSAKYSFRRKDAEDIKLELKKAKLVSADKFPANVVGLNSTVKVIEDQNDKVIELTLVTPDKADIKKRRVSVMAPIGIALIGFRQGQKVNWQGPSGSKTFTIMEVSNQND
jgi:regulator of nucleoside diphosphate kinase